MAGARRGPSSDGPAILRLLPDPLRPYSALRDDLVALGWEWADESQTLPLLPGEPEWVHYRHPSGAELEYEFLPPVGLRTLVARGDPDVLAPLGGLPQLSPVDLAALLGADDPERVLRGLLGVQALVLVPLIGRVRDLAANHPDPLVRGTAEQVAERLPALATEELAAWQSRRAAHPGHSLLLAGMPVADRRQVLRWMGADLRAATAGVLEALRTGLADDDAEVRATAVVVAARLGAVEVTAEIEGVSVPAELSGAVELARAALRAGRTLAIPEPADEPGVLLAALALPVVQVPPPGRLPAHLVEDRGVRLRRSGVLVALVPAVPHWLFGRGDGRIHHELVEPFAVTAAPVEAATARVVGLPADGAGTDPVRADADLAEELAARVSTLEGVPLQVVTADRWEAALRGPDGRAWTSGNLAPAQVAVSPWGALAVPGVRERLAHGLAADPADLGVVWPAAPDERLPVRLAMRFPI